MFSIWTRILLLGFCLPSIVLSDVTSEYDLWTKFKSEYNKTYRSLEEETQRNEIFLMNVRYIDSHNNAQDDIQFYLKINQFADLTNEEYRKQMTLPISFGRFRSTSTDYHLRGMTSIPDEVDWRRMGFVSPVKDQGPCAGGSIFAAIGAMEGQERGKFSSLVSLSAQQLFDCCGTGSCPDCSTGGGLSPVEYFECVDDIVGLDSDRCYPFTGKCHECKLHSKCISVGTTGYADVQSKNEEALKQTVALIGPVAASIDASRTSFQFLSGQGVYSDASCSKDKLNHSILIIGYGVQGSTPYWLIKNSWGTNWGDKGYAKIIRNQNMCGIATQAVYPYITTNV